MNARPPIHVAFDALTLRPGAYSGVHVAVRGQLAALAGHVRARPGAGRLTYYALRGLPDGEQPVPARPDDAALAGPARGNGGDPVRRRRVGFPAGWRAGRIWWEDRRLPRIAARDGADVLHCPAYVGPARPRRPMVLGVHDIFGLAAPQFCTLANRQHLRRRMPAALAAAARIVTPTAAAGRDILRWRDGGGPLAERAGPRDRLAEKIRAVPWGVDARFRRLEGTEAREALRMKYRLPPHFALAAARPEPKKNLEFAVRAFFAATVAGGFPHRLALVGPPGWGVEPGLARTVAELGLADRVVRPGFVPDGDMPGLYSLASCLLFPSLAEGFGLPVLEAMACGCPVVASPLPPLVELIGRDGALWAPPTDLAAWRAALEAVFAGQPEARRLAADGPGLAAPYTWARHAEGLMAVYAEARAEDTP